MARSAAIGAALLVLAACTAVPAVDPRTAPLLERHGLRAAGPTTTQPIVIDDPSGMPWDLYRQASEAIGLGEGWDAGALAELRITPVAAGVAGVRAFVLVTDGQVVGAWLGHPTEAPGVYSLAEPP